MTTLIGRVLCGMAIVVPLSSGLRAGEINLSVAASLREAVTALSEGFTKKNPGARFQTNFAGSGALAKQIENGASCDVFFSANLEWMDYLAGR